MFKKHYLLALEYGIASEAKGISYLLKNPDKDVCYILLNNGNKLNRSKLEPYNLRLVFGKIMEKMPELEISYDELECLPESVEYYANLGDVLLAEILYQAARRVKSLPVLVDLMEAAKRLKPLIVHQDEGKSSDNLKEICAKRVKVMHAMYSKNHMAKEKSLNQALDTLAVKLVGLPTILQEVLAERAGELIYHHLIGSKHPCRKKAQECQP
jgi:hypothetical protein